MSNDDDAPRISTLSSRRVRNVLDKHFSSKDHLGDDSPNNERSNNRKFRTFLTGEDAITAQEFFSKPPERFIAYTLKDRGKRNYPQIVIGWLIEENTELGYLLYRVKNEEQQRYNLVYVFQEQNAFHRLILNTYLPQYDDSQFTNSEMSLIPVNSQLLRWPSEKLDWAILPFHNYFSLPYLGGFRV